jgi:hypothetical protein
MSNKSMVILHSALVPEAVIAALHLSVDEEHRTLFSFSGYKGSRPVLGEIGVDNFRVQKRRYWRNDFAPHFYGRLYQETGGTRIEGYFDSARWVKLFMRFWIGAVVLFGSPIFIRSLLDVTTVSRNVIGDAWVGVIVPPAMVAFGFLLPKFGRLLGRGEERLLLAFLENSLVARTEH